MKQLRLLFILLCLVCPAHTARASSDTISIDEVHISAKPTARLRHEAAPVQTLNAISLERLGALQVGDAVKTFAGVQVKDYGGIGGLKTVSVRSMGAKHTAVSYDGVMLSDEQSGQVDVGKLSLDNVQMLSLANGQLSDIFLPAKAFAAGSVLTIETAQPAFSDSAKASIAAVLKVGSFGFWSPAIAYTQAVSRRFAFSVNGEYQTANGSYPYTLYNGDVREKLTRANSDIRIARAEANLFARITDEQNLSVKFYLYDSERGLPGSTIFYNPYSAQRLWDNVFFAQLRHTVGYGSTLSQKSFVKYNRSSTRYLDPHYPNAAGVLDNRYAQGEVYASTSVLWQALHELQLSASLDGACNTLDANLNSFANPTRYTLLGNLAAKYEHRYFEVMANVLGSAFFNRVEQGSRPDNAHKLSPAATLSVKPLGSEQLLLRFFYKDIFRMPSFNDLYYGQVGNTDLRPEKAQQYNVGAAFYQTWQQARYLSLSADVYRNYVSDKIVAIPTKDLFVWSVVNMGRVKITGIDLTAKLGAAPIAGYMLSLNGSYTYQKSIDKTNPQGSTYNHQIPYTPRHSGSAGASLEMPYVSFDYNIIISGSRYKLAQNIDANYLSGYADHSITARTKFSIYRVACRASVEVLNLLNTQYEVVHNFPMPKRSVRATLTITV